MLKLIHVESAKLQQGSQCHSVSQRNHADLLNNSKGNIDVTHMLPELTRLCQSRTGN